MTREFAGIVIMLAAATVESFAQLFLKLGAAGDDGGLPAARGRRLPALRARSWVLFGVLAYAGEIVLYTAALHFLDVSVAFPLGSLCFVGVALLSRLLMGEAVGPIRWVGVTCIMMGAVFVAL